MTKTELIQSVQSDLTAVVDAAEQAGDPILTIRHRTLYANAQREVDDIRARSPGGAPIGNDAFEATQAQKRADEVVERTVERLIERAQAAIVEAEAQRSAPVYLDLMQVLLKLRAPFERAASDYLVNLVAR